METCAPVVPISVASFDVPLLLFLHFRLLSLLLLLLLLLLSRRSKSLNTIPPNKPYAPPSPSTTCHGSNELYVCECVRECCIVVDVSAGIWCLLVSFSHCCCASCAGCPFPWASVWCSGLGWNIFMSFDSNVSQWLSHCLVAAPSSDGMSGKRMQQKSHIEDVSIFNLFTLIQINYWNIQITQMM